MIPRLRDVVELSELASKVYTRLNPQEYVGMLAPSLGLIVRGDLDIDKVRISDEFLDPITFLSTTYFSDTIKDTLRMVNTALQRVGAPVVLRLTHAMGRGKTHFLVLLYHLYLNIPFMLDKLTESQQDIYEILTVDTSYKVDVARKTLIIPIDLMHIPTGYMPYDALMVIMGKVFERKRGLLVKEGIPEREFNEFTKILRELNKYKPLDAARKFSEALSRLGITIPILIVIDELYAGVLKSLGASSEYNDSLESVLRFISNLVEELRAKQPVVVVYASALQDEQRWIVEKNRVTAGLRGAVEFFEDRMGRYSPASMRDISIDEALWIVKKRVLRLKFVQDLILKDVNKLRDTLSQIVETHDVEKFIDELKSAYPFSPTYKELVAKLVVPVYSVEFRYAQHLRDLIKVSSDVLNRALQDEESYLVSLAHVEHEDIKHLLDPLSANEWKVNVESWRKYVDLFRGKARDPAEVKMLEGAIRAVYVKSVTDNIWDLIRMSSVNPDHLSREDIERRALHQRRLILSLVGLVDVSKLGVYQRVLTELDNIPFIHSAERSDGRYYYASLIGNPIQILNNIREGELRRLRDEKGELKVKEALEYLSEVFKEYALVSQFRHKEWQLNFEFVKLDSFDSGTFLNNLDRDTFTALVISPIDVAEKLLIGGTSFEDLIREIKSSLETNKNKIRYLNMFAVIIPYLDEGALSRLVESLAEIKASEVVVEMLKKPEGVDKLAEEIVEQRRTLKDMLRREGRPEEELRHIMADTLITLRRRIEDFAKQLANAAVQNFTSDLISIFKKIITYDPCTGQFEIKDIRVGSREGVYELGNVFASLPIWMSDAVKGLLKVADASGIRSQLIEWIKRDVRRKEVRENLVKYGEFRYDINIIVEALARGWCDIPIKPISIDRIEVAIKALNGSKIPVDDVELKIIEIAVEDKYIVLKVIGIPPLPPPSPPGVEGFKVLDIDDTITFLSALPKRDRWLTSNTRNIHVIIHLKPEGQSEDRIDISGSVDRISEFVDPVIRYLNRFRDDVGRCELEVRLNRKIEKREVVQKLSSIGLKVGRVKFTEG
jgi:hypothetical protein